MATMSMSSMNVNKPKRARKANWEPRETEILVDFVSSNGKILNSSFNSTVTNKQKTTLWSTITDRLNATGSCRRDPEEVKKKWSELKSNSRKKAANVKLHASMTGGGPPPQPLSDLDLKILSTIPKCQTEGCEGGLESEVSVFSPSDTCVSTQDVPEVFSSEQAATPVQDTQFEDIVVPEELENTLPCDFQQPSTEGHSSASASCSRAYKRKITKSSGYVQSTVKDQQASRGDNLIEIEKEKLAIMRQMLAIMQRRLELEEERMRQSNTSFSMSLSPVIKF